MSKSKFEDFVDSPVPINDRKSYFHIFTVWVGFIVVVGIMAVGGGLVQQATQQEVILAIIIGNIILGLFAALSGYVASESGLTFAQLTEKVFPGISWRVVSLYSPLALIGWYAIECAIFGSLMGNIFGIGVEGERLLMALSAILFGITPFIGWNGIKWISALFVPLIIILGIVAVFKILGNSEQVTVFANASSSEGFGNVLKLVIGSWILGVVAAYPDLARFAKNPKIAALLGFLGILIFNSLTLLLGVVGSIYTGQYDPSLILISLGAIPLAFILGVTNLWTTNDNNLYSASLSLSHLININRKSAVIISAIIGLVIAYFNPAQFSIFFSFLGFLGNTAPALGGVIFGSYLMKKFAKKELNYGSFPAWVGWILGSIFSFYVDNYLMVPIGFISGFLIWFFVGKFLKK